jgi:hypothetical protein
MSAFATTFVACDSGSNPVGDVGFKSASAAALGRSPPEPDDRDGVSPATVPPVEPDLSSTADDVDLRLDLDDERRIAGVSNDSRGRVSSTDVYLPMEGR